MYYSMNRLLYPLSAAILTLALAVTPWQSASAATSSIERVVVSPDQQKIAPNVRSQAIKVQFLNASGVAEPLGAGVATLSVQSESTSGAFFSGEGPGSELIEGGEILLQEGDTGYSVYYVDATKGKFILTFTLTTGLLSEVVIGTDKHMITVEDSVEEPSKASADIEGYSDQPHVTKNPIIVSGTLRNIPEAQAVRLSLRNASNAEVAGTQAVSTSEELGQIGLTDDIANGDYTVKLIHNEVTLADTPLKINIPAPPSPSTPPTVQEPVAAPSIPREVATILTLDPIQPLSPTLSTQFSTPATLSSARSQNFVANASQSAAPAQVFAEGQEGDKPVNAEQSLSLNVREEEPILEPSHEGWRIFGAPWYLWGGGAAIVYGAWFGIRRLVSPLE